MKRGFRTALFPGILAVLIACSPMAPGRTEPAAVEVETVSTPVASVSRADVYLEDGRLVVAGSLRRTHEVKMAGHVDIIVCGPEGLLERKSVPVPGLSSRRRGVMELPFTARFELVPPPGAKVVVQYHGPSFADEKAPECG